MKKSGKKPAAKSSKTAVSIAMKKARELEFDPLPPQEDVRAAYEDAMHEAEHLRTLLKPAWFMRDEKRDLSTTKKRAKVRSPSRKKKTL